MEMFPLVLQNRTHLYISVEFSVVRMNAQILQRKEVLLKTCLKYRVLKFQMVVGNRFGNSSISFLILLAVAAKFGCFHFALIDIPGQ